MFLYCLSPGPTSRSPQLRGGNWAAIPGENAAHVGDVLVDDELEPVAFEFVEISGQELRRELQAMGHEKEGNEDVAG